MSALDKWLDTLPTATSPAPVAPMVPVQLSDDPEDMRAQLKEAAEPNPVLGLFTVIEYDHGEFAGRRRITMKRLSFIADRAILYAICHEAQGFRQFNLSRITAFFSLDGEVIEPDTWWSEIGLDPVSTARGYWKARAWAAESALWPQMIFLSALAHADGLAEPRETSVITEYVADEVERAGILVDETAARHIANRARRLRPHREDVENALSILFDRRVPLDSRRLGERSRQRFFRAAARVVDADGHIDRGELAVLDELARHAQL